MFEKLIWVMKDSLSESFCNEVIEKFDEDPRKSDGIINQNNPIVDKDIKDTQDLNISSLVDWSWQDKVFFDALQIGLRNYRSYLESIHVQCYPNPNYEIQDTGYKIQKYNPDGHYTWHNDWTITNQGSRIFVFMWYLNTIDEKDDGYTEFLDGTRLQPECGSLVFFPATWTYVHRGKAPKVCKYITNGWIYSKPLNSTIRL